MSDTVLLEIKDGIALITLNRPDKLNALNYELIDRLMAVLDQIEVDAGARVVVLTGAGDRAFSAGADIHEFSGSVALGAEHSGARLRSPRPGHDRAAGGVQKASHCRRQRPRLRRRLRDHRSRPSRHRQRARLVCQTGDQSRQCRRPSAAPSGCRGWPGASARWNCC